MASTPRFHEYCWNDFIVEIVNYCSKYKRFYQTFYFFDRFTCRELIIDLLFGDLISFTLKFLAWIRENCDSGIAAAIRGSIMTFNDGLSFLDSFDDQATCKWQENRNVHVASATHLLVTWSNAKLCTRLMNDDNHDVPMEHATTPNHQIRNFDSIFVSYLVVHNYRCNLEFSNFSTYANRLVQIFWHSSAIQLISQRVFRFRNKEPSSTSKYIYWAFV